MCVEIYIFLLVTSQIIRLQNLEEIMIWVVPVAIAAYLIVTVVPEFLISFVVGAAIMAFIFSLGD